MELSLGDAYALPTEFGNLTILVSRLEWFFFCVNINSNFPKNNDKITDIMESQIISAIIGIIGGGVGVKIIDAIFLPKVKQEDIATIIREELRADIQGYKEEVEKLREDLDYWKTRYFELIEILVENQIPIPDDHKHK